MPPRFHAPDLDIHLAEVTLRPGESQHLTRVLRLGPGAAVELFDGKGLLVRGEVLSASHHGTVVSVGERLPAPPELPDPLVVCAALLKGDAMDTVVRDATVLGATAIVPVTTRRTNVPGARAASGRLHERWHRVSVAAAKQCGRAALPEMSDVQPVDHVWDTPDWQTWERRLLVEPAVSSGAVGADAPAPASTATAADAGAMAMSAPGPLVLACGPEGGWDAGEIEEALAAGWTPWSLGPFTLRAEQVTLAALAVVRHAWSRR